MFFRENPSYPLKALLLYMILFYLPHMIVFYLQVGEVGEMSKIFQWRGEEVQGLPNKKEAEKEHLGEELFDVLLYLIRLEDICGIDLGEASTKKMVKNVVKYPASKAP